jgi:outer membrane protein assembly factor BamB
MLAGLTGAAAAGVAAPTAPAAASSLTAPLISSFSPSVGVAGAKVTIKGSGFEQVRAVRFNGVAAAFKVRSGSKITVWVPAMPSAAGPISVSAPAWTARSRARFTVAPAVRLSQAIGPPGSAVTLHGTGFGAFEGVDIFVGTADRALAGTSRSGSFGPISVSIPASAAPGADWISAQGRHSGLFAQAAFTVNTNWPQFGYSAGDQGFNPYENMLSATNVAQMGTDWSFDRGGGASSSATEANGLVYVGTDNGKLYALNAATGATRWTSVADPYHEGISSFPAVANGTVYVGSYDYDVYAFNAATGARRWIFDAGYLVASSAAVVNGVVYVPAFSGNLYALNAATGVKLWQANAGYYLYSPPAVANGVAYIGSGNGDIYAFSAATGFKLWTFDTGDNVYSSPAVANGVVYTGSENGNVYAINATTGDKLWTFSTGTAIEASPAVADGVVYIGSGNHNVYALNAATGAELWSFTTGGYIYSSPAVANGVVYIGSDDHNIYALSAATGTELWSYATGGFFFDYSAAVANGTVYMMSSDGHLYAFGLPGRLATAARPNRGSLHPDYSLRPQR